MIEYIKNVNKNEQLLMLAHKHRYHINMLSALFYIKHLHEWVSIFIIRQYNICRRYADDCQLLPSVTVQCFYTVSPSVLHRYQRLYDKTISFSSIVSKLQ